MLWSVTISRSDVITVNLTAALEDDEILLEKHNATLMRSLTKKLIEIGSGEHEPRAVVSDVVVERLTDPYYAGTLHVKMEGLETDVCWTVEFGHGDLVAEFKPASGGDFEQEVLNRNYLALVDQLAKGINQARDDRLDQGLARDMLDRMHEEEKGCRGGAPRKECRKWISTSYVEKVRDTAARRSGGADVECRMG